MPRRFESYRAKRDFSVTTEPPPEEPVRRKKGKKPFFMVHKHDASRLHYDLRLEMAGALASWAIPRGPSYDPKDKRLAVQTEDHPLAYGDFEGRIPDGEYGAGDSIIWDRGTYQTEPPGQELAMREKGHLALQLEGEKLKGLWHLVRTRPSGGKEQWIFFKGKDALTGTVADLVEQRPESVVSGRRLTRGPVSARTLRARHPMPVDLMLGVWPPMRATLSHPEAARRGDWLFEVKYDGFRALAAVSGRRVALQSRNGLDLSQRFPSVAAALSRLVVGEAVLDGEIVAFDQKGVSRFQLLQQTPEDVRYAAFDLLWLEGENVRDRPVEERRELLESLLADVDPPVVLAERIEGSAEKALEFARRRGLEGVLAKRAGSRYRPGASRDWLKLKLKASQDVAIIGYLPISHGGNEIGALLTAVQERGGLRYVGRVGTGFSTALRRELFQALEAERVERPPAAQAPRMREARWAKPRLVGQVEFTEWTADGKLRQPSFQGLRPDKRPEECTPEIVRSR